jgi:hypothetical protein
MNNRNEKTDTADGVSIGVRVVKKVMPPPTAANVVVNAEVYPRSTREPQLGGRAYQ